MLVGDLAFQLPMLLEILAVLVLVNNRVVVVVPVDKVILLNTCMNLR